MKEKFSLKDALFNEEKVEYLAGLFAKAEATFKKEQFVREVMMRLLELELKERIVWIAEVLEKHLSLDFKQASGLIQNALPRPLDSSKTDDDFGDFILAPLGEYVVRNGLKKEYLTDSFQTLLELTQRFSMEDATRSFLNSFPKETLAIYKKWSTHENYHVRRLVSESTRPLLPWSRRLSAPPETSLQFLDVLYADTTRYVTRSVANHLNDISKKKPEIVVATLEQWKTEGRQREDELNWMTKHALRTVIKQGNKEALALLGFGSKPKVILERFSLSTKKIVQGETLTFSFTVKALKDENLLIDYVINFVKANGSTKPKVFKLKKVKMMKGESLTITKKHTLKADATTFTLYNGEHALTLQINGQNFGSIPFKVM